MLKANGTFLLLTILGSAIYDVPPCEIGDQALGVQKSDTKFSMSKAKQDISSTSSAKVLPNYYTLKVNLGYSLRVCQRY